MGRVRVTGAVLRAAVVALAHAGARVVRLPEPAEQVGVGELGGVVHDLHRLGVPRLAGARLLVRRVGRVTRGVPDRGGVDAAARQPPRALLATPEAAVGEDRDLEPARGQNLRLKTGRCRGRKGGDGSPVWEWRLCEVVLENVMFSADRHLLSAALERGFLAHDGRVRTHGSRCLEARPERAEEGGRRCCAAPRALAFTRAQHFPRTPCHALDEFTNRELDTSLLCQLGRNASFLDRVTVTPPLR